MSRKLAEPPRVASLVTRAEPSDGPARALHMREPMVKQLETNLTRGAAAALLGIVLLAGGALLGACGDSDPSRVSDPHATAPTAGDPNAPPSIDGVPGIPGEEGRANAAAQAAGPPRAELVRRARQLFDTWAEREAALVGDYAPAFKVSLADVRWYKRTATQAYEAREFRPFFSEGAQLSESADKLLEALYAVEDHGLDPAPYELDALRDTVKAFSDRALAYQEALTIPVEVKSAWDWVNAQRKRMPLTQSGLEEAAASAGLADDDVGQLDAVAEHLDGIFAARVALNTALRDLDIALVTRYLRYIYDMRFARRAHPFFADESDGAGIERTAEDVYATFAQTDFGAIGGALAALVPKIGEYALLKAGLAQYRRYAEEHPEHIELPARIQRLRPRDKPKKDDLVEELQRRLAQEDYWTGPIDGLYGPELEEAVRFYQETHQINETGRVDRITRISLNRSFAERAEALALGLRRHRESELHQGEFRFGETRLRGRINIPAFQATFFRDGDVARQHKVIVGNNNLETDAAGKRGYFNQTRMFTSEMRTIVLNPTWNVPPRIKQDLDMKLLDQPDFYERHNYAVKILPSGNEQVTQLPGPNNALGLVKFLFPNQFAIYMHDTPNKRLFNRTIRAFSYGCMRTEDPLDLAKWLLVDEGEWTEERFDEVLRSRQEYGVALKEKIPITVDYNTVGVHPSGKIMFYADIYRFDRDYFAGKTPYRADRSHYMTVMAQ